LVTFSRINQYVPWPALDCPQRTFGNITAHPHPHRRTAVPRPRWSPPDPPESVSGNGKNLHSSPGRKPVAPMTGTRQDNPPSGRPVRNRAIFVSLSALAGRTSSRALRRRHVFPSAAVLRPHLCDGVPIGVRAPAARGGPARLHGKGSHATKSPGDPCGRTGADMARSGAARRYRTWLERHRRAGRARVPGISPGRALARQRDKMADMQRRCKRGHSLSDSVPNGGSDAASTRPHAALVVRPVATLGRPATNRGQILDARQAGGVCSVALA
jgi:hypothetical protein